MCERVKNLPNINDKLFIYATPSGILAITSDLSKSYYSVYLDGVEPGAVGLFVKDYPTDFRLFGDQIISGNYGAPVKDEIMTLFKSFEVIAENEKVTGFEMSYPLYKGMGQRLIQIALDYTTDTKPHTRFISVISDGAYAELAATDNKTLCVFQRIPVTTEQKETLRYLIPKSMFAASLSLPEAPVMINKIYKAATGEYRIQIICGDYLFVEKQYITIYPTYLEILRYYEKRTPLPLVLTPIHLERMKNITPFRVDEDCTMVELSTVMNMLCPEPDASTSDAVFNKAYVERLLNCLASPNYTICTGTEREQMQLTCKWGKAQEYNQILCVMPIDPATIRAKEIISNTPKTDEPVSSCNIKSLKNLI